jgi:hypothetical protein
VALLLSALSLSFWNPSLTPRVEWAESVIYVQTSPEILDVIARIRAEAARGADPAASVTGEASWPLNWYLRRLPVSWANPDPNRKAPVAIVDSDKADDAAKLLGPGYSREEIPLRSWWLPDVAMKPPVQALKTGWLWEKPSFGQLATYLFTRKPWSVIGSQNVTVFTRNPS